MRVKVRPVIGSGFFFICFVSLYNIFSAMPCPSGQSRTQFLFLPIGKNSIFLNNSTLFPKIFSKIYLS